MCILDVKSLVISSSVKLRLKVRIWSHEISARFIRGLGCGLADSSERRTDIVAEISGAFSMQEIFCHPSAPVRSACLHMFQAVARALSIQALFRGVYIYDESLSR